MDDGLSLEPLEETPQTPKLPVVDEAALTAQMDEVEASPLAMAKKAFIVLKTAFVVYQTLKAARAWAKSKKPMGKPAMMVLLLSAAIMIGVATYKFTSKAIRPLIILQGLSHYVPLCVLHVLLGYVDCENFPQRRTVLNALTFFHVIFWAVLGFASVGATCTTADFYPDAFLLTGSFTLGIYLMACNLQRKNWLLEWKEEEDGARKLFEAQIEGFMGTYTFLVELHALEIVLGKTLDTFTDSITCSNDGQHWFFTSAKGNLFLMLHIIGTSMGAGLARAVFIKTVKNLDVFGGLDDSDDEDENAGKGKGKGAKETKKSQ